jgi:signal transduction histidine kinase
VAASLLPATADAAVRVILNFQDVSETTRLRERLRQSETMAEIGALVAGVAHEVRNPLFSISATLDAFESRHGRPPSFDAYLGVLREEIGRLSDVMRDLLEFGRGAELELEDATLAEVVELAAGSCRVLAATRSVEVAVLGGGTAGPLLRLDRQRLSQVFENLISNAIYFSRERGTVSVELEAAGDGGSGAGAVCRIRDRGPGIAEADLPRLFEPFFTRRSGGTGLGLSIVRRIVEEHGGQVAVENQPGGGALVTVRLPPGRGADRERS